MAVLKAFSGEVVTIGAGLEQTRTTWTDPIVLADPATPLLQYEPGNLSPLAVYASQPAVRTVVGWAARQFGSVPWKAYARKSDTDRERKSDSPAEKLLRQPGKFSSGYNLMENLLIDKMLYDRWCMVYFPATDRLPGKLLRIPPRRLDIKANWLGEVKEVWILNPVAGEPDIDITDAPMALSFGWSGESAGGISPMKTLRDILLESRRAVEWRSAQWDTAPKLTGLLKHPSHFDSKDKKERFRQSWQEFRDLGSGTPLLEDGLEYEQLDSMSMKDAQDLDGRKLTNEEVATAFFNYPELLGMRESTFSNMVAFRQMIHGLVLGPHYADFQQAMNGSGLISAIDASRGLYVEADRETAIAGSFLEQAQIFQTMVGGPIMTTAEARARMNLPYLEGTDELIKPLNVTQGGQASPTDSGDQNKKPNTEPEQETD